MSGIDKHSTRPGFNLALPAIFLTISVLLIGCDTSQIRSWHTRTLNLEFPGKTGTGTHQLEDYMRLEDAVFAQLDEKIYQGSPRGVEHALQRFSAGSIADPRDRQPNWNRSFILDSEQAVGGVLLLHGMSDSPYSLRALGQTLHRRGFTVVGLRMPGHGTAPSGLTTIRWQDMSQVVRMGMGYLQRKLGSKPVHIIGYSTGAALALDYSLEAGQGDTAASLVLISPAIGVTPAAALAAWIRRLASMPGLRRLAWQDLEPEFDPYKYNSFAMNAAEQVYRLTRSVSNRLEQRASRREGNILPPTLVLKSTVDATVSNDAVVDRFLMLLPPHRNELVLFDVNRFVPMSPLLIADPAPMTARLIADATLPFDLTLIGNTSSESREVSAYHKAPFSTEVASVVSLNMEWPMGVYSLSHVALPFPPNDPLYGRFPPTDKNTLFLGQLPLQGERGLLKISPNFLLRLRYNPFYDYMEQRVLAWMGAEPPGSADQSMSEPAAP